MTPADRELSLENFRQIVGNDIDRIAARLAARAGEIKARVAVDLLSVIRDSLVFGLHAVVNKDERPIFQFGTQQAFFFLHYFVRAYLGSDLYSRSVLRGRLNDGVDSEMGLPALFLELAQAHTYLRWGNDVEFLEAGEVSAPDLLVRSRYQKLYVECKCVFVGSRQGLPAKATVDVVHLATKYLASIGTGRFEKLLTVEYVGSLPVPKDAIPNLAAIFMNCEDLVSISSCKYWKLEVSALPEGITQDDYKFNSYGSGHPALRGYAFCPVPNAGFVVVRSIHEWKLDEAISDVTSKALKQLPSEGYRIAAIQILGSGPLALKYEKGFVDVAHLAMSKHDNRRRFAEQARKKNGFVGLQILGDFYTQENGLGDVVLNYPGGTWLSSHAPDSSMWACGFMNMLPSELVKMFQQAAYDSSAVWWFP
ncbi:hypothetical protein J2X19_001719 [Rhodoferax ferrireducens]|uniref:Uncharacterized protein n=1 Tax=Rhodoferax ferrireducens TaxID=192843 RepID=A0ABU2C6U4_9BURK|nr:hypothetical protein [Rhodoferax ferrireducens]MDR7377061.1 hypothetical protein [Rhodoferax ferrireducens]